MIVILIDLNWLGLADTIALFAISTHLSHHDFDSIIRCSLLMRWRVMFWADECQESHWRLLGVAKVTILRPDLVSALKYTMGQTRLTLRPIFYSDLKISLSLCLISVPYPYEKVAWTTNKFKVLKPWSLLWCSILINLIWSQNPPTSIQSEVCFHLMSFPIPSWVKSHFSVRFADFGTLPYSTIYSRWAATSCLAGRQVKQWMATDALNPGHKGPCITSRSTIPFLFSCHPS
jgi:hypothetical protein